MVLSLMGVRRHKALVLLLLLSLMACVWYWLPVLPLFCLPDYLFPQPMGNSHCSSGVQIWATTHPVVELATSTLENHSKYETNTAMADTTDTNHFAAQAPQTNTTKNGAGATPSKNDFAHSRVASEMVSLARNMTAIQSGPLLLTIINFGYLPITYNWLCHTAELPGVHKNVIVLVQGEDTETSLKRRWPDVKTVTVNQWQNELHGPLQFGTVGYVRMMVRRTDVLNALIQADISFVLFETDFVWFENPVPDFLDLGRVKDLDLVGTVSTAYTQIMCGAFIYFRNTTRTRKVWAEVTRRMHELERRVHSKKDRSGAPYGENEQIYLNRLLKAHYADVRYGLVDLARVVADGHWYTMKSSRRLTVHPKAIHNNFQRTTARKVKRFQRFGQWVLNSDLSCNVTKVQKLLARRK